MTAPIWNASELYDLRWRALWNGFRQEGVAFWLLCTYLMFEYVRPQSAYPVLAFFPWSSATMFATGIAIVVTKGRTRISSPANGLLVLFSVVVLLSSINAYRPEVSWSSLDGYYLWLVAYALVVFVVTSERRMLLMMLAFVLFNLKMSLFATRSWVSIGFAFRSWGVGGAPGWFQNSGEFGIEMCVFFPIITYITLALRPYLPRWKLLALLAISGTSLVGMIASSSRGALLGGAAVMILMLARSRYKVRALIAAVAVGTVLFVAIPPQSKARLDASGTDKTSLSRLTYWTHGVEIVKEHPLLGIGYANWVDYYAAHFGYAGREEVAHNTFVQAGSELGLSGLAAFLLLIGCTFMLNSRSRARAIRAGPAGRLTFHLALALDGSLVGFLVSGFFISALYYPYMWINLAMTVALNTVAKGLPVVETGASSLRVGDKLRLAEVAGFTLPAPQPVSSFSQQ